MLGRTPATTNPKVKHVRFHTICGSTDLALEERTWTLGELLGAEQQPTVAENHKFADAPRSSDEANAGAHSLAEPPGRSASKAKHDERLATSRADDTIDTQQARGNIKSLDR